MKNFLLVTNSVKDNHVEASENIIRILEKNGCRCTANLFTKMNVDGRYLHTDPAKVPEDTEGIISLGGDGTFIHAAKDLVSLGLPIFGVNFGTLGYLTEVPVEDFEKAIRIIIRDEYHIEDRMLIKGALFRGEEMIYEDLALNDIVLSRTEVVSVIDYDVYVNGVYLNSYSADGAIISTPTGSTGYNLSAGGPVVMPTSDIILLTPICAHALYSRSLVFPANVKFELHPKARVTQRSQGQIVTFDGEKEIYLEAGDVIKAKMAGVSAKVMKTNKMSFVEHLSRKMR